MNGVPQTVQVGDKAHMQPETCRRTDMLHSKCHYFVIMSAEKVQNRQNLEISPVSCIIHILYMRKGNWVKLKLSALLNKHSDVPGEPITVAVRSEARTVFAP
jgi:hypothetical protein